MRTSWRIALTVVAALAGALYVYASLSLPQDKGPQSLDVSSYPARIRSGYQLAVKNCSDCHTFARVLNTTASPQFWGHYLGSLQTKGSVKLSNDDAVLIYDFLIYDEIHRKELSPKSFYPPLTEDQLEKLAGAQ